MSKVSISTPAVRSNAIVDFYNFRQMIIPLLIRAIYIIGSILFIVVPLVTWLNGGDILSGMNNHSVRYNPPHEFAIDTGRQVGIVFLFIVMVVLQLIWRIFCELIRVIFRIHDALQSLDQKVQNVQAP